MSVHSVLLVEDDIAFARFLIGSFRDVDPKIDVFHVNNGYAALSVINSGYRPDLILCEDHMPRMSCGELMSNVRTSPLYQSVPFVMLTSSFTDDLPPVPGRMPIDMKVPRPSNYREALALVSQVLAPPPQEDHNAKEEQTVAPAW
ncbi:MAG: response regulator [Methanomassiliicoccus sp.]|nr:response regulator [Methanomassiliicoccus sp.]